jgi:hypothetical protein
LTCLKAPRATARILFRMLLDELMRRQGAVLPDPLTPAVAHEHALAVTRCGCCASRKLCAELLQAGRAERQSLFCPNAHYVAWVRHNALRF